MYNENTEGGIINQHADASKNPEIPVLLRETIALLQQAFHSTIKRVATRGPQKTRRRRAYVLHHMAHGAAGRIERAELAFKLKCSVATVDKDIRLFKRHPRRECESRDLPPKAFESLIHEIG